MRRHIFIELVVQFEIYRRTDRRTGRQTDRQTKMINLLSKPNRMVYNAWVLLKETWTRYSVSHSYAT